MTWLVGLEYQLYFGSHYENTPIQYIENFTIKNWKFSDKNSNIFSTFLLKT